MESQVCERKISLIKLGESEKDEFLDFVSEFLKVAYEGEIEFLGYLKFGEDRGAVFQVAGRNGVRFEILVIASGEPLVKITSLNSKTSYKRIQKIADSIEAAIVTHFEKRKMGIMYHVYVEGRDYVPSSHKSLFKKVMEKILLNKLTVMLMLPIIAYYLAYFLIGPVYAPVFLTLAYVFSQISYFRIVALLGDWKIDRDHNKVYIVKLAMPLEKYTRVISRLSKRKKVYELKRDIARYVNSGVVDKRAIRSILAKYGIFVDENTIGIKTIDLYKLVSRVFTRFKLSKPSIYIINSLTPNALISGICSRFSTLTITSGLLIKLSEEELEAVLGHEASHIKNKDIPTLFLLSSLAYIFQAYLVLDFLGPCLVFIFYVVLNLAVLTGLFFVAKILEVRADIEAALFTGGFEALKSAMRKIAYQKIIEERSPVRKLMRWFAWKQHPPVTFRLYMLDSLCWLGRGSLLAKILRYSVADIKTLISKL